jgi:hypothetical protein
MSKRILVVEAQLDILRRSLTRWSAEEHPLCFARDPSGSASLTRSFPRKRESVMCQLAATPAN